MPNSPALAVVQSAPPNCFTTRAALFLLGVCKDGLLALIASGKAPLKSIFPAHLTRVRVERNILRRC
jgi:hypothetical protein